VRRCAATLGCGLEPRWGNWTRVHAGGPRVRRCAATLGCGLKPRWGNWTRACAWSQGAPLRGDPGLWAQTPLG